MADLQVNDPVMVKMFPSELMIGARVLQVGEDIIWVDICGMGTHLPQMYRRDELQLLDSRLAVDVGLCGDCLGYGTPLLATEVPLAASIDLLPEVCASCGGSGRTALRVVMTRSASSVQAEMHIEPHAWLGGGDICLACGVDRDHHG